MSEFEKHAAAALERYENGESIEAILTDYPDYQTDLRAMLGAADALEHVELVPSAQAKARSRQAFLADAASSHRTAARPLLMRRLQYLPLGIVLVAALVVLAWFNLARSNTTIPATPAPAGPDTSRERSDSHPRSWE